MPNATDRHPADSVAQRFRDVFGLPLPVSPPPVPGDPAPAQECGLLVISCKVCGNSIQRWRPTRYALECGTVMLMMGCACTKCGGDVSAKIERFEVRVPEGPVGS